MTIAQRAPKGELGMKLSTIDVIKANLDLVKAFVTDIRQGDSDAILLNRVGGKIQVSPDDQETEDLTVTFHMDMYIAVSKQADATEVVALLNHAIGSVGAMGSIGTGSSGGTGNQAVNNLAQAAFWAISNIAQTAQLESTIIIHVPVKERPLTPPHKPFHMKLEGTVSGWTVTTDTGADSDWADVTYFVKLAAAGNPVETKNDGLKKQIAIESKNGSVVTDDAPKSPVHNASMEVQYKLGTDGYWLSPTVSIVQIKEINLHFILVK
jgi:hypothetical protein